jgi:hypothetical protein
MISIHMRNQICKAVHRAKLSFRSRVLYHNLLYEILKETEPTDILFQKPLNLVERRDTIGENPSFRYCVMKDTINLMDSYLK